MLRSLRTRLVLAYFAAIFVAIILAGSFVLLRMQQNLEAEKASSLLMSANIAADEASGIFHPSERSMLRQVSRDMTTGVGARVLYLDRSGRVLADGFGEMQDRVIADEVAQRALAGDSTTRMLPRHQGALMYAAVPVFSSESIIGATFVSANVDSVYEEILHTRRLLIYGAGTGAIAAAIVAYVLTSNLTAPLRNLARAAHRLAAGRWDRSFRAPQSSDEVGDLGRAFEHLVRSLEHEDRIRRMFVDNASHEIRSPLASLRALTQGLLEDPDADPSLRREFLEGIDHEIDRLDQLADGLTMLSASQTLRAGFIRRPTSIAQIVRDAINRVHKRFPESANVPIHIHDDARWPVEPEWLGTAIENLLQNAIKHVTREDGRIEVRIDSTGNGMRVTVEDNGPGVPPAHRARVFERFYRVDKARERQSGGSGIGLSIVEQVVKAHGGEVSVDDSTLLGGARFTIVLPP